MPRRDKKVISKITSDEKGGYILLICLEDSELC